ncbi:MAG: hypothetical protein JNL98_38000 [Bryobacterales bacterium]|nr:hypothetical protein [Bryobacterales bacterium]
MADATASFRAEAARRKISLLQELLPGALLDPSFDAYVVADPAMRPKTSKPVIVLGERRAIGLDAAIVGTRQGVWPGIEIAHGDDRSHPTGGAWIHTNTGVLRFLRSATKSPVWIANTPPEGREITGLDYLRAIADAAAVGARWVITFDARFLSMLLEGDRRTLADWARINEQLRFYEDHKEWRDWPVWSQLALLQDVESGALVTGSLMDMLAVLNTPVRAMPSRALQRASLDDAKVAIVVNPQAYTAAQQTLIERFAQSGGKVVTGPKGWKMPVPEGAKITFDREHYKAIEAIWPELHSAVNRKNFAARLFNVSGTLSYLQFSTGGKRALLNLVNYTDYPVEAITAFVQGKYKSATLYAPGRKPVKLTVYDAPEGTGVEIESIATSAAVLLE